VVRRRTQLLRERDDELDLSSSKSSAADGGADLQPVPVLGALGPLAAALLVVVVPVVRVQGRAQVRDFLLDVGAVARAHELLGRRRRPLALDQGAAALLIGRT
jgi:hypothetical protein